MSHSGTSDDDVQQSAQDMYPEVIVSMAPRSNLNEDRQGRVKKVIEMKPLRRTESDDIVVDEEQQETCLMVRPRGINQSCQSMIFALSGRSTSTVIQSDTSRLQVVDPIEEFRPLMLSLSPSAASRYRTSYAGPPQVVCAGNLSPIAEESASSSEENLMNTIKTKFWQFYVMLVEISLITLGKINRIIPVHDIFAIKLRYKIASVMAFNVTIGMALAISFFEFNGFTTNGSNAEYPATTKLLLAATIGALGSGFHIEQVGLIYVTKSASILFVASVTILKFFGGTASEVIGCFLTGFSLGVSIPASILWTSERVMQSMWGMTFTIIIVCTVSGMITHSVTTFLYCMMWVVALCQTILLKETKEDIEEVADEDENLDPNLEAQPTRNRNNERRGERHRDRQYSNARRSNARCSAAWDPEAIKPVWKSLLVVSCVTMLQQISGPIIVSLVATDFFTAYKCYINFTDYTNFMLLGSTVLSFVMFACLCWMEKARLVCLLSQLSTTIFIMAASFFCLLLNWYDSALLVCYPGILMSMAGLLGLAGAVLVPMVSCMKLLPSNIRPPATGAAVACAIVVLVGTLHAYQPLMVTIGRAAVACLISTASIATTLIACRFFPNV